MASPPSSTSSEQPHILSLVLQSKKALQHGEQLCSRAKVLSNASAQSAIDILALDAKVRWITESVLEQLKLAAHVAKSLEDKRAHLENQIQEWDTLRTKQTHTLDSVLDSLGAAYVPPDFHQTSPASSIFGSQHSDDDEAAAAANAASGSGGGVNGSGSGSGSGADSQTHNHYPTTPNMSPTTRKSVLVSPAATLRNEPRPVEVNVDRSGWKTLRDFVNDKDIDAALERMESDRAIFDDMRVATAGYTNDLMETVEGMQSTLAAPTPLPPITDILRGQDQAIHAMAEHLENLASHYDQIAEALKSHEEGEEFAEDEIEEMNNDMNHLPSIIEELEESFGLVESAYGQLQTAEQDLNNQLSRHPAILGDLDELGNIMTDMLDRQQEVETNCAEQLGILHDHLQNLEQLHEQFKLYQTSFHKLLLEIARRRRYQEGMAKIVDDMVRQLKGLTEEEESIRIHFNAEHGAYLPEDLCLCIGDKPTKWDILPLQNETVEVLPEIDNVLLLEAKTKLEAAETATGTELSI